ncbi:MAG: hypothetical protein K0Q56_2631 [Sporolactobacillus laevolacticus]|jgi:hypothetical protein|nr:hypothetical protein [Sporolactobacillus laevolacticus]
MSSFHQTMYQVDESLYWLYKGELVNTCALVFQNLFIIIQMKCSLEVYIIDCL